MPSVWGDDFPMPDPEHPVDPELVRLLLVEAAVPDNYYAVVVIGDYVCVIYRPGPTDATLIPEVDILTMCYNALVPSGVFRNVEISAAVAGYPELQLADFPNCVVIF